MASNASTRGTCLFMAPSFLADRRHKRIHGAEVFNLLLIRRLVEAGVNVTVMAEHAWRASLGEHLAGLGEGLRVVYSPPVRKPIAASLALLPRVITRRYDLLVVGNVARGVLPAAWVLVRAGRVGRVAVISHQYPKPAFLRKAAAIQPEYICASGAVASLINKAGPWPTWVHYGVQNPEEFFPAEGPRESPGAVHFGLIGQLDTPWKGAHLAIDAWSKLPSRLSGRAKLHLCAYKNPPAISHPDIVLHDWLKPSQVGAFMRTLDALVVPSTSSETFSQVMAQGMLTALPVFAYDLPVLTEKLDTCGGRVFRTSEELADQITAACDDPESLRAMGKRALETARERYIWRVEPFLDRFLPAGQRGKAHGAPAPGL